MTTILIVEDDKVLREVLAYNLNNQGYETLTTVDGIEAMDTLHSHNLDMIILDLMLPGMDGFEICRRVRRESTVPILMLTARDDEIDRVVGLEVGADDYMGKPFSMRELLARIKAMLRRSTITQQESLEIAKSDESTAQILTFSDLSIDLNRMQVKLRNKILELKPKEYDLLLFFAQNPGKALSREKLLEQVWGWDYAGESRTVDVHVRWLRLKIEEDPTKPTHLLTIRGTGYRFEG